MPNVSVKILSGDIITLDVLPTITCQEFYIRVYDELPVEVKPKYTYQMKLLRAEKKVVEDEDEDEDEWDSEVDYDDNPLEPSEEEMFYAVFESTVYWTEEPRPQHLAVYDPHSDNWFEALHYTIYCQAPQGERELVRGGYLFNGVWDNMDVWLVQDDVKWQWSSEPEWQRQYDILLDLPTPNDNDEGFCFYPSLKWAAESAFAVKGISKHVRAHLMTQWLPQATTVVAELLE